MVAKKSAKRATPAAKAKTSRTASATKKAAPKKTATRKTATLPDWREETLSRMRRLIEEAVPGVVEERKWKKPSNPEGVPVWSLEGMICTGETYKDQVKLTFAQGARLPDPARLFNSSLEGNQRRAIDIREGDEVDETAFKALVRAAAALNSARAS